MQYAIEDDKGHGWLLWLKKEKEKVSCDEHM